RPPMTAFRRSYQFLAFSSLLLGAPSIDHAQAKRALRVEDLYRIKTVRDVQLSPEGNWVACVVSQLDSVRDESNSDIYVTSWDVLRTIQLTHTPDGESSPRWS